MREFAESVRVALYGFVDLPNGQRLHFWGHPPEKFAVGHGPITDVSRDQADAILRQHFGLGVEAL